MPIAIPGLPAPVKLGPAGGPLVIAIPLVRIGHLGPLVPRPMNHLLRDFGIALFLAAVGLKSGAGFLDLVLRLRGAESYGWAWPPSSRSCRFPPMHYLRQLEAIRRFRY